MRALIAPYELCAALSRSVRWTAGLSIAWRAIDETIFNYRVLKTITAYAMDTTIGKTTLDAVTILPSREKTLTRSSDPDGYRLKNHRYTNLGSRRSCKFLLIRFLYLRTTPALFFHILLQCASWPLQTLLFHPPSK